MIQIYQLLSIVAILMGVLVVEARFRCHNRCSGHGYCSDYDNVCYCKKGYQGVDCSQRTCPMDFAWADKAYRVDAGHSLAECSNAGKCNRRTGVCECSSGYTGIACEKTKCGGSGQEGCNGHGDCLTIGEVYLLTTTVSGVDISYEKKKSPAWETNHVTMCSCHPGYSGASCEYRLCPKGDDPMTPHTGHRTITITVHSSTRFTSISGNFLFHFNGESFLFAPGEARFNAAQCKAAFEGMRNVQEVRCTVLQNTPFTAVYTVEFIHFPVLPYETSIYTNDGNPPLSAFTCNTEEVVSPESVYCTIDEINTDKIYPEYAICANRGICDFTSGVCYCFQQFMDANCASYKKAIAPATEREVSSSEVLIIESSNPDFESTILRFQTFDIASEAFNTLQVNNLDRTVFNMDGSGNVVMNYGSLTIGDTNNSLSSGMTINVGGLRVTGGITAYTDTLVIDGPVTVLAGGVSIGNGGLNVVGDAYFNGDNGVTGGLSVTKGLVLSNGGLYIGAGGGTISTGGLSVSGGLTIFSNGLVVEKRGVTIYSGGLVVTGGIKLNKVKSGINVGSLVEIQSDGITITGGLTVSNVGLDTNSGMTIGSGGLVVSTLELNGGGVVVTGGLTVASAGLSIASGGMTIQNVGVTVLGGVGANTVSGGGTISTLGITVPSGVTVVTGGVAVASGLTVASGDVNVLCTTPVQVASYGVLVSLGIVDINSGGLVVTGGLTVENIGVFVDTGGLSINAGGLRVTGGFSAVTDGLFVIGGTTINNVGVYLNDRLQIQNSGLVVNNGLTINDGGVSIISGGVTVATAGLQVTNGLSINLGGLRLTGGLSVEDRGLKITGGVTINTQGLRVNGGMTMYGSSGLRISGGLSVSTPGLSSAVGMTVSSLGLVLNSRLEEGMDGVHVYDGVSLSDVGLVVSLGGLEVQSPSLFVTGGLTVFDTGAFIANSMSVQGGGVVVGGLTVSTSGVRVVGGTTIVQNGLSVVSGGVTVFGGVRAYSGTVQDLGVTVTGGLSVTSGGVTVNVNGLTVNTIGVAVTGGITLQGSLKINGGFTTNSAGVHVDDGGVTLSTVGLVVNGGLTISGSGLQSTAGILQITSGGLYSEDALSVVASGVKVAGGLTLADIGLYMHSLVVQRNGITSSSSMTVADNGVLLHGDSSATDGLTVVGGMTVSNGGVTLTNSATSFVNIINAGGLQVKGAAPVVVNTDGVFCTNGITVVGAPAYFSNTPTTPSDQRLKQNITRLVDPLGMLQHVRGVSYNWKDADWDRQSGRLLDHNMASPHEPEHIPGFEFDGTESALSRTAKLIAGEDSDAAPSGKLRYVGFLAQELQKALPEVVSNIRIGDKDYLGVNYVEVVALVIEAIKVLDERTNDISSSSSSAPTPATHTTSHFESRKLKVENSLPDTSIEVLMHKYFKFDDADNSVIGLNPYNGTCDCAEQALPQMLAMLKRIQDLEREEAELLSQLEAMSAL